jgi:hypothetical protein
MNDKISVLIVTILLGFTVSLYISNDYILKDNVRLTNSNKQLETDYWKIYNVYLEYRDLTDFFVNQTITCEKNMRELNQTLKDIKWELKREKFKGWILKKSVKDVFPIDIMENVSSHTYNRETYNCQHFSKDLKRLARKEGYDMKYCIGWSDGEYHAWNKLCIPIEPQLGEPIPLETYKRDYDEKNCW